MTLSPTNGSLLQVRGVSFVRNGRKILDSVDVSIEPGRIITLIGPNGAGKTTLVRLMLGLDKPDSGQVIRLSELIIGYMPQRLAVPPFMPLSVERFIRLGVRSGKGADADALYDVAAETGITHLLKSPMQGLSGGEHQRVLLCRALIRQPQLLVLDEPVQGVDVGGQAALYQLIARLRERRHCAIVMVSHDLHLVMAATDEVLCLNGHVCCAGHPDTVSQHDEFLALFGPEVQRSMAPYTHHHQHRHTLQGNVIPTPVDELNGGADDINSNHHDSHADG
ncbi:MAG: zinc import ATP-binding protein ZnuC [marine bacterium B5-7]|nr:MAG: zinc import ATP-binding protein ZnuC [marine bacterium B5-7]